MWNFMLIALILAGPAVAAESAGTRLLRQPDISSTHVTFNYAGDIWTATRSGTEVRRLTRIGEAESFPRFSPDGLLSAFTRRGDMYVIPATGGLKRRPEWTPSDLAARRDSQLEKAIESAAEAVVH